MRAQSQGHHAIDRLEERGIERGAALDVLRVKDEKGLSSVRPKWECFKDNTEETFETRGRERNLKAFPSA